MNVVVRFSSVAAVLVPLAIGSLARGQDPGFILQDIGGGPIAGSVMDDVGTTEMTAGGAGVQGTGDQFTFAYQWRTNNFDLAVRLTDPGSGGVWVQAGLMARNGFTPNAPFAAALASTAAAGCSFANRPVATSAVRLVGWFPVNYPDTWLRLRRMGNQFTGYASLDGQNWEFLGATNISMPAYIPVGLALSSGTSNAAITAHFRDFANAAGVITTNQPIPFEPLGPSSRRSALVFSEFMYHPPDWAGTNDLQFVELYNSGTVTEDLTGHRLSGDIQFDFPAATRLAPGEFLVVAADPAALYELYGVTALGPFEGNLSNEGGTLRLISEVGGRLLEVAYDTKWPWPAAADGAGHSLVLRRPSYGENDPQAWAASDVVGGSPGRPEHYGVEPARTVVINEFLAHTDLPQVDFVELYNHGNSAVDLSGCIVSDRVNSNRYTMPPGTTIPARGFLLLDENQLGFRLNAAGGKILLRTANQKRVLDAVNYDAQENGVACGRWPDGANRWSRLAEPTGGAPNAPVRLEDVVINELLYDPISGDERDQYIELYNAGSTDVDLGGWKLEDGVDFTVPTNITLSAGGYLVIGKDSSRLLANYPQLNSANTLGNFSGKFSGKGECIALAKPDTIVSTNDSGEITTNEVSIVVDEVVYGKGGRWPRFANGGGSSLELIDPRADRRLPSSWADSDESLKAPWTTVDVSAMLENGQGTADRLELFLEDEGEALVDNLEMLNNGGANKVANPGFDSGLSGFTLNGTHRKSYIESAGGPDGSAALHLVATGRGDAGPNKVWTSIPALITGNPNTGTIRAQARWLKGSRFLMLRPRGHWMEAAVVLAVPSNPGTPGLRNSRYAPNAGPAIYDVSHWPVLPAAYQSVVVTARAQDPDGVASITLSYRLDPNMNLNTTAMRDDGFGGDAVAGDGVYSATIPGLAAGALVAFRVNATDAAVPALASVYPPEAPTRECLVRWGESVAGGTLGTYRIWITAATVSAWTTRERNANDPLDCTFVYGNSRVAYNAGTQYSGSPFHTLYALYTGPTGSTCDYEVNFRPDDKFLGAENFVLTAIDVNQGGTFFPDPSAQVEITGNWIMRRLGQSSNHKRHVFLFVNGLKRGTIYEDSQQPNSEYLDEFYPGDENGELRKIEDWFEFDTAGNNFSYVTATIEKFIKSTGQIDTKRYRWNWRPRASDNPYDWTNFTNLVNAMNSVGAAYVSNVLAQVDVRQWLGSIAVHHLCGDWDSYGYERGKNSFAYRPDNGRWRTLLWDIELCLGDSQSRPPTDSIYSCVDPALSRMLMGTPALQREYLGLMQDALNGPFAAGAADPLLDERYASLQRNGVPVAYPSYIKTFIASRRSYVQTQIPVVSFTARGPATSAVANVTFTGTAPVTARTLVANGRVLAPAWPAVTTWSAAFLLAPGSNWVSFTALDFKGNIVGATNLVVYCTGAAAWPPLRINEWMADNSGSLLDPADNDADDWFELYNPTPTNVNLAGWTLTDTPTNLARYVVPAGYSIPANGYLLVWADGETGQNTNTRPDLHVDFKLSKEGEAIALFAPDGSLVDAVTFGPQTNDISQGRWPNGGDYYATLLEPTPGDRNIGPAPATPMLAAAIQLGQVQLTFVTSPGFTYGIEWASALPAPAWTLLAAAEVATNGISVVIDPDEMAQQRFYRVVLFPW